VTLGRALTVSGNVTDANDDVAKVELFVNGQKVGEDTSAPWQLSWTPQNKGLTGLKLVATDKSNLSGESAQVDVQVEEAALPLPAATSPATCARSTAPTAASAWGMTTAAASSGISPPGAPARTACPPTW
jgi:hypothetical protein